MSLPILITGGNNGSRKKKAEDIAANTSSAFDTAILDTKQAFGIGDVRAVNEQLTRRPFQSSEQTVIIIEAQNLTLEAQTALLKTLEEASERAKIILTAPSAESLLSTITSRCQNFELKAEEEAVDWRLFETLLKGSLYRKYALAASLDIDNWLAAWRKILLARLGIGSVPFKIEGELQKIVRYVRLLCKAQDFQKRKAAPKLLKTILLLEAPTVSPND